MRKILCVEDDYQVLKSFLSPEGLFYDLLEEEEQKSLDDVYKQQGAFRNSIKQCLKDNPIITVEFDFLEALRLLHSDSVFDYDYFIIDRNLGSARNLDFEDIKKIDKDFNKNDLQYIQNREGEYSREGDYLLMVLFERLEKDHQEDSLSSSFFFLSSYPGADVFKNENRYLYQILQKAKITEEHYLDKDKNKDICRLKSIISIPREEYRITIAYKTLFSFFNGKPDAKRIRKELLQILEDNQLKGETNNSARFNTITHLADALDQDIYEVYFEPSIEYQKAIINKKTSGSMQKIDAWYTTSKTCIPPNVIECGDTIRHFRNVIRHTADTGWKNNTSFLMLKAMVLNLFEIIRVLGTDIQYDKKNKKWWISYISKIQ